MSIGVHDTIVSQFRLSSAEQASRDGTLYRTFYDGEISAGTTFDFVFSIPEGVRFYGFSRVTKVFNGTVFGRFGVGGTYSTVAESFDGFNFDETIDRPPLSQLLRVTDLTGVSWRTPDDRIVSPTTGSARVPSVQTEIGAQPRLDSTRFPVFEYRNEGVAPVEFKLTLVWQELR